MRIYTANYKLFVAVDRMRLGTATNNTAILLPCDVFHSRVVIASAS